MQAANESGKCIAQLLEFRRQIEGVRKRLLCEKKPPLSFAFKWDECRCCSAACVGSACSSLGRKAVIQTAARYVKIVSGRNDVGVSVCVVESTSPGAAYVDGEWLKN